MNEKTRIGRPRYEILCRAQVAVVATIELLLGVYGCFLSVLLLITMIYSPGLDPEGMSPLAYYLIVIILPVVTIAMIASGIRAFINPFRGFAIHCVLGGILITLSTWELVTVDYSGTAYNPWAAVVLLICGLLFIALSIGAALAARRFLNHEVRTVVDGKGICILLPLLLILILVVLYELSCGQGNKVDPRALEWYKKALEPVSQEESLRRVNIALEIDKDFAEAYSWRAGTYKALGIHARESDHCEEKAREYFEKAIPDYEAAIRLQPNNTYDLSSLAHLYEKLQRYDEAEVYTRKALEIDPENENAKSFLEYLECIERTESQP